MTQGTWRKLGAALIIIGAALLLAGFRSPPAPAGAYAYSAIIEVRKLQPDDESLDNAVREEKNLLESNALLQGVVSNLNLTAKWSKPNDPMSTSRAAVRLSSNLRILTVENSGQIRVRVSGAEKQQTEEIAQSVLRVYTDLRRRHARESKPKNIVKLEEQLEEIEPKLRLAIDTLQRVGKELTITDFYQPPKEEPTLLDRIRDGKEDEATDYDSSAYSNDPVPKNETPEQAKKRIYLRSVRVADVLTLRKRRIEAQLAIERSRTATATPTTVQIIQQPQLDDTPAPPPKTNRGWVWVGAACLMAGVVSLRWRTPSESSSSS